MLEQRKVYISVTRTFFRRRHRVSAIIYGPVQTSRLWLADFRTEKDAIDFANSKRGPKRGNVRN